MGATIFVHPLGVEVSRKEFDRIRVDLAAYNRTQPPVLQAMHPLRADGLFKGMVGDHPLRAMRSQTHIAMLFKERTGVLRLTVCRAKIDDTGHYEQGLSWEELMEVKRQAGFAEAWAVEVFPPDDQIVNVANMRHLWILPAPPDYGWNRVPEPEGEVTP